MSSYFVLFFDFYYHGLGGLKIFRYKNIWEVKSCLISMFHFKARSVVWQPVPREIYAKHPHHRQGKKPRLQIN